MNSSSSSPSSVLVAAIGAALMFGMVSDAAAQSAHQRAQERRERREQPAEQPSASAEVQYPNASRESPSNQANRAARKMQQMVDRYDDDQPAQARALADEIIAAESSNNYERSFSAQFGAQVAYEADDTAAAIAYLERALEFDGLDNNSHFAAMWMLAQLQAQEDQYPQALATIDRLTAETGASNYEHLMLKGRVLNRAERYPEAIATLQEVMAIAPEGKKDWQAELMHAYAQTEQSAEAAQLAETIAAQNPNDKRSQLNLAATYQQADMLDKSAEIMEKLRASGQLIEDGEYRQLYSTYLNLEGREGDAAKVISEGIEKGVLKPDYQAYQAQAQAYYFSDQIDPAIDAYRKAAPLDDDGETYLNLARVLWQEARISEAKEAARQAIAKGLDNQADAQKIIALPNN